MISAVICEYNPFHNGHKYQLERIKQNSDAVICIMSGDFVQRGDIAVFDKFQRAKAALLSGADLVIMLPVCYSLASAELFAQGGVHLCNSLCIVDRLYFGSECGDIKKLISASEILLSEPQAVSAKIKQLLKTGMNYPSAKTCAYEGLIDDDILSEPNNILALEYIKAIKKLNSKIEPVTIKRNAAGHHDIAATDKIASATAIRSLIYNGNEYNNYIPDNAYKIFCNLTPAKLSSLDSVLSYVIRTKSIEEIANINDVGEGLENRIKSSVSCCSGFCEISEYVKTKRYTLTKINRILLSLIMGIDKNTPKSAPDYIRVLGMNDKGAKLLSMIKSRSDLPIITKTADFKGFNKSFEYDMLAADLYSLSVGKSCCGTDYKKSPIKI